MLSRIKSKRKFSSSVKNCINGFKFININEDNFKREIFLGIIVLILSYVFRINKIEFIIIIIMIGLVLVCETINTAVERLVDLVSPGYNKIAGEVKDIMAFAVLLMCIISLVIGAIIFIPKIISLQGGI